MVRKSSSNPNTPKTPGQMAGNEDGRLVVPDAYKERCKAELSVYRALKTHNDVLNLMESTVNAFIAGVLDVKQASTLGYMAAVTNQTIRMTGTGAPNAGELDESLHADGAELNLTDEELKAITSAPTRDLQIRLINKVVTRTETQEVHVPKNAPKIIKQVVKNSMNPEDIVDAEEINVKTENVDTLRLSD